jgi:hypothetical protein
VAYTLQTFTPGTQAIQRVEGELAITGRCRAGTASSPSSYPRTVQSCARSAWTSPRWADVHELRHAIAALQPIDDPCHADNGGVIEAAGSAAVRWR